jgi:hypothetical protein
MYVDWTKKTQDRIQGLVVINMEIIFSDYVKDYRYATK